MNKQQMHEAMRIAANFAEVNDKAKIAADALSKLRSVGGYFITHEQNLILRDADKVLDEIRDKSTTWEAGKYAIAALTENPSLT